MAYPVLPKGLTRGYVGYILPTMPKVSFYLRNEDLDSWKAITKKTEFIHNAIYGHIDSVFEEHNKNIVLSEVIESPVEAKKTISRLLDERMAIKEKYKVCKIHGTPLTEMGKCLQKGCKFA